MCIGTGFFAIQTGWGGGHSVIEKKAAFITRYSGTSYMDVMNMTFGQIDSLFENLSKIIEIENKALQEEENGTGKNV